MPQTPEEALEASLPRMTRKQADEDSTAAPAVGIPLDHRVRPLTTKARRLVTELEAMGHRNVRVWWNRIGMAPEMCGPSGGWLCESDMTHYQPEPLGLSFDAALHAVRHHSWLDFRHVPEPPNAALTGAPAAPPSSPDDAGGASG